jgi:citrate lyase subunit beta/citryl-CoA lyase
MVNACKAAGIQAIDSVFSDVADVDGLKSAVQVSRSLGFEGMGCIHPRQIKYIKEGFLPDKDEIEKAKRILLAYESAQKAGLGVVSLGTKMIDAPVVKRAERIILLALKQGLLTENWKKEQKEDH